MLTVRVSHLAAFARWQADEDLDTGWMVDYLRSDAQTLAMARGTAFHKFLEHARTGEIDTATVDGFTFTFTGDFTISLPPMRELRKEKNYGELIVSGCVDAISGNTIWDHKTTEHFDAEHYLSSWQHKFYLDIFEADRFIWNVWEVKEMDEPKHYCVHALHQLEQYRYPGLEEDCRELTREFAKFAQSIGWTGRTPAPIPAVG